MANLTLIYELADALYRAGYEDKGERDFYPRGTAEWQAVVDALSAAEDRAKKAEERIRSKADGSDLFECANCGEEWFTDQCNAYCEGCAMETVRAAEAAEDRARRARVEGMRAALNTVHDDDECDYWWTHEIGAMDAACTAIGNLIAAAERELNEKGETDS